MKHSLTRSQKLDVAVAAGNLRKVASTLRHDDPRATALNEAAQMAGRTMVADLEVDPGDQRIDDIDATEARAEWEENQDYCD